MSTVEQKLTDKMAALDVNGWPAPRIRSTFINYFVEKRGHTFWASSPVVPMNDPTLLFINAGMNQFKPLFLGTCDPSLDMSKLKMAVNSQKCIRAGGKHNDLEDVGKDVYHHTFFEMLGNWSFGSYFKEEAITWAWECLTVEFGLDPTRLYATYFGGDEKQGLAPDLEAKEIWLRFLTPDRVLPFGCKDNFWEMGATGPCGPCTEIHYDRIGNRDAASFVNADRPDVIEIWNNVFIQFNREADGSLKELPNKHVDTGMGFERLSSILQGKDSNYDTDIFQPIFQAIQNVSNCRPYEGKVGADDVDLKDMAYRVVADHIRTLTFAITDGAVPSNDGRGYVLRRILRRAVRYGTELLGAPAGFFAKLVPIVVQNFSDAFPELLVRQDYVIMIISEEEQSFTRTLDQGVKHFRKVVASLEASGAEKVIPANEAHLLFSSMGFPLDLTELMAAERGFTVDKAGFEAKMEQDRKISEEAEMKRKGGDSKDMSMESEQTSHLQTQNIPVTCSDAKYKWHEAITANIVALYQGRGTANSGFTNSISSQDGLVGIITDVSSFYYESGGQIFDTGRIVSLDKNLQFEVRQVQTYAGYVVHVGYLSGDGSLSVGEPVQLEVDYTRRSFIAPNHTMTHVLNFALRTVLSETAEGKTAIDMGLCEQKGSLVDADKLRFDFSWTSGLTPAQIAGVEAIVNERIRLQLPVYTEVVPLAQASSISSLRKVFGETYPDPVRVVSVGVPIPELVAQPDNANWANYAVEFCGGTHLTNTQQAEDFVLVEESGIAKGIRRIVGLTRSAAQAARRTAAGFLERLSAMEAQEAGVALIQAHKAIKLEIDQAVVSLVDKELIKAKVNAVYEKIKVFNKANEALKLNSAMETITQLAHTAQSQGDKAVIATIDFGADGKVAKKIFEKAKSIVSDIAVFVASPDAEEERVSVFAFSGGVSQLNAKAWVDFIVQEIGEGRGGGKNDQANASLPCTNSNPQDVSTRSVDAAKRYFATATNGTA
jgi:alanyl-tRNA synthetase